MVGCVVEGEDVVQSRDAEGMEGVVGEHESGDLSWLEVSHE